MGACTRNAGARIDRKSQADAFGSKKGRWIQSIRFDHVPQVRSRGCKYRYLFHIGLLSIVDKS
jgi:hypothetical protein